MEGRWLIQWAAVEQRRLPELSLLAHVPNGGARDATTGALLKAEGVRAGYPDYLLDVARGRYHGLRIELKAPNVGRLGDKQDVWLSALRGQGYAAYVCEGWRCAADLLRQYLGLPAGAPLDDALWWAGKMQ